MAHKEWTHITTAVSTINGYILRLASFCGCGWDSTNVAGSLDTAIMENQELPCSKDAGANGDSEQIRCMDAASDSRYIPIADQTKNHNSILFFASIVFNGIIPGFHSKKDGSFRSHPDTFGRLKLMTPLMTPRHPMWNFPWSSLPFGRRE